MSKSNGNRIAVQRELGKLSSSVKSTGKRGAQLFVGKSFPPQVMAIAGDIEIARKFCLKFNLVKEEERQLDLYLKRGQIFTKSALKPLIVTFIANAKKAGEYAEPGNHHDRLVDPILEDIKRDDEAARRKLGQGFIEERRLQDPRPNPNADRLAQSQLESQQTNLWQASPQTIQPIPPGPNVYAKNNNGRSYMQDYGQINGHISASYVQRKRTGGDPHCNTVDRHISVSLSLDHRPHMYSQDTRSQVISPVLLYQQLVYNFYIILIFWPQVYLGASAVLNNLLVVISSVIRYCRYCAHAELFE